MYLPKVLWMGSINSMATYTPWTGENQEGKLAMDFQCFCRLSPNYTYLTCRNFVCQHSVVAEKTVKQRAFAFIMSDFQHVLGHPVLFLAHVVNIRQTSCRDSARLCLPDEEVGTRRFQTVSPAPLISCHWVWRSHRGGNQRVSFQKCANLVIARTD